MGEANATKKTTSFFKGLRGEFKKISWPAFPNLMKQSGTVIVVSLIIGLIVMLIDMLYNAGIYFLLG